MTIYSNNDSGLNSPLSLFEYMDVNFGNHFRAAWTASLGTISSLKI